MNTNIASASSASSSSIPMIFLRACAAIGARLALSYVLRLRLVPAVLAAVLAAGCAPQQPAPVESTPGQTEAAAQPPAPGDAATTDEAVPLPPPVARPANRPPAAGNKNYARAAWNQLPGWGTDSLDAFWKPFLANCRVLMLRTGRPVIGTAPPLADPYAWQKTCAAARDLPGTPSAADVRAFLEQWLQPWTVLGPAGENAAGLATSYYEPLVHGSRERANAYQWPLYAVPADLLTIDLGALYPELAGRRVRGKLDGRRVVPFDTRAELEQPGRQPPALVWINDPVDAFFLQVQGSGRVVLDRGPGQGSIIRLAYADHNGQPYVSIGKWLVDKGELTLSQASAQNIRAWAQRNPDRVREMLNANPAVVFFREEVLADAGVGPRGALGVPLSPLRSVAVDAAIVPLGVPAFLATTQPNAKEALNLAVLAQDTGAAIKGPARVDLFWGFGDEAGDMAGKMKQPARLWVLWPKGEGAPLAAR